MVAVTYYCPRCETVVSVAREGYLSDKSVTPYPLEGWTYAAPDGDFGDEDGVRFVCGESEGCTFEGEGCGEPFYLNFLRFEGGEAVEAAPESERVELAEGEARGPGPGGPGGPGFR
jgi:hypothetical protein